MSSDAAVSRAARRAARAVHRRATRATLDELRPVEIGHVFQVAPVIVVELAESPLKLEEGTQLRLSDQLRWWDANFGIQRGDPMALVELSDFTWVGLAMLTDRATVAGAKAQKPPGSGFGKGDPFQPLDVASEVGLLSATAAVAARTVSGTDSAGDSFSVTVPAQTAAVTISWADSVVAKMPVYDATGALVGYVPVFQDLPA